MVGKWRGVEAKEGDADGARGAQVSEASRQAGSGQQNVVGSSEGLETWRREAWM